MCDGQPPRRQARAACLRWRSRRALAGRRNRCCRGQSRLAVARTDKADGARQCQRQPIAAALAIAWCIVMLRFTRNGQSAQLRRSPRSSTTRRSLRRKPHAAPARQGGGRRGLVVQQHARRRVIHEKREQHGELLHVEMADGERAGEVPSTTRRHALHHVPVHCAVPMMLRTLDADVNVWWPCRCRARMQHMSDGKPRWRKPSPVSAPS